MVSDEVACRAREASQSSLRLFDGAMMDGAECGVCVCGTGERRGALLAGKAERYLDLQMIPIF